MVFGLGFIISAVFLFICFKDIENYKKEKKEKCDEYVTNKHEPRDFILSACAISWIIIHFILILAILICHTPSYINQQKIKYEQLNENRHNNYLIQDIIDWNEDIIYNKKYQHNFWIGPYIPNIYDNFKVIEIDE